MDKTHHIFAWIIVVLSMVGIGVYSYLWGVYDVKRDMIPEVYGQYLYLHMEEDGSYRGEDNKGNKFQGCIKGALCDDTNIRYET